jgi:hypothetical protein
MKNLIIILLLILPTLTFSQSRKELRQQRKMERKYLRMERQNASEWNMYEIDLSDFYNIYNGSLPTYQIDWTTSPAYTDYWKSAELRDDGTIINLFEEKDGVLRYTESIYLESTKPQFWEIQYQNMYNEMLPEPLEIDF